MKQVLFLFLLLAGFQGHASNSLSFTQAWVQEGPPGSRVLAGFMNITNASKLDIIIESASSDNFKRIEFHQSINKNGMARMQQHKQLLIKPGATLKLEHGSFHLMLIKPEARLKAGDRVNILFRLSNQTTQSVNLTVKKQMNTQQNHELHH